MRLRFVECLKTQKYCLGRHATTASTDQNDLLLWSYSIKEVCVTNFMCTWGFPRLVLWWSRTMMLLKRWLKKIILPCLYSAFVTRLLVGMTSCCTGVMREAYHALRSEESYWNLRKGVELEGRIEGKMMACVRKVALPVDGSEHSERACDCTYFKEISDSFYHWCAC